MRTQQSGFTLVEIAIVLVIIGLLLGGVLKGQELINSAKSKAVISDFRNTATMIAAYQDRFRALPGDDPSAVSHLGSKAAQASSSSAQTVGNGLIEGSFNSTTSTDESVIMWQHLRLANLASGDAGTPPTSGTELAGWRPKNSEGGNIGVQSKTPITDWAGRQFICQENVSGRIAQQVDTTMDDGNPSGGSVRFGKWSGSALTTVTTSGASSSASSGNAMQESDLYVVCASF